MPSVISLKELKDSNTLKEQIRRLEEEKKSLEEELARQKKLEARLREDILSHKKDFEHLEKQFDHFAGIEAEFEALQTEIQMERLENMVSREKEESKARAQLKKAREELREVSEELKALKKLDPQRLKRQVADLKKKAAAQTSENKTLNRTLVNARRELRESQDEKEKLEQTLEQTRCETDFFWQSDDGVWTLYETRLRLKNENGQADPPARVRCLNLETGVSVISAGLDEDGRAAWLGGLPVPEPVCETAGRRLRELAGEEGEPARDPAGPAG